MFQHTILRYISD